MVFFGLKCMYTLGRFKTHLNGRDRLQPILYLQSLQRGWTICTYYILKCNIPEKAMNNRPSNLESLPLHIHD